MTLSPGFISLCDPLHLSAGRTCDLFLPTDYVKGNVMSLLRLHYVKFHRANRLNALFLSCWF